MAQPNPEQNPLSAQTEARIAALEAAVGDIRDAVVSIARLEERHTETRAAIAGCMATIQGTEKDLTDLRLTVVMLEGRIRTQEEIGANVMRGVWGLVGVVLLALVGLVVKAKGAA